MIDFSGGGGAGSLAAFSTLIDEKMFAFKDERSSNSS